MASRCSVMLLVVLCSLFIISDSTKVRGRRSEDSTTKDSSESDDGSSDSPSTGRNGNENSDSSSSEESRSSGGASSDENSSSQESNRSEGASSDENSSSQESNRSEGASSDENSSSQESEGGSDSSEDDENSDSFKHLKNNETIEYDETYWKSLIPTTEKPDHKKNPHACDNIMDRYCFNAPHKCTDIGGVLDDDFPCPELMFCCDLSGAE